jgi:hypothetical protein
MMTFNSEGLSNASLSETTGLTLLPPPPTALRSSTPPHNQSPHRSYFSRFSSDNERPSRGRETDEDRRSSLLSTSNRPDTVSGYWEVVDTREGSIVPCQRSLHAGAIWRDSFIVFGGYDGFRRVNDLHSFNFKTQLWQILNSLNAPSPRDRHVSIVHGDHFYVFGGFDGQARVDGW